MTLSSMEDNNSNVGPKRTPIDALPLFNDAWVYCIFAVGCSWYLDLLYSQHAFTSHIESTLIEPYAIRAFFILAGAGFLGMALISIHLKMNSEELSKSKTLKLFVAISEVGLSTGSIISGAALGVALYFGGMTFLKGEGYSLDDTTRIDIAKINFFIFVQVFFIVITLATTQRLMLSKTEKEGYILHFLGLLYCSVIFLALFYFDPSSFYKVVTVGVFSLLLFKYVLNKTTKNKKQLSR